MKITIDYQGSGMHFIAKNEEGNRIEMDASPAIGGTGLGARPMQLLIMGLGGCSGIDVVSILRKQKQSFSNFQILLDAKRQEGVEPSLFTHIHMQFVFDGDLDHVKLNRAVQLSVEKYCSVARTLEKTAQISYSIHVNGQSILDEKEI